MSSREERRGDVEARRGEMSRRGEVKGDVEERRRKGDIETVTRPSRGTTNRV